MSLRDFGNERHERWTARKTAGTSDHGVVTAQHFAAAEAGAAVLSRGGNAVDAAVTAGFLLQTVEPWMSGLFACGHIMIARPGDAVEVIDFTGRVPQAFDATLYQPDLVAKTFLGHPGTIGQTTVRGYTAPVVPGAVKGLALALERHGSIGFDATLAPAIERASGGLAVDWHTTLSIAIAEADLRLDPAAAAYFMPGGTPPEPGSVLPPSRLLETLQLLARNGPEDFYTGEIAQRLLGDIEANGGAITAGDLRDYEVRHHLAERFTLAGKILHVAGPDSGGRRLREALQQFEHLRGAGPVDAGFFTTMAQTLWDAFAAHRGRLTAAEQNPKSSTTQVNAADRFGNMVSLTFTLLNRFGGRVISPSTGILLNNGMSWFDPRPGFASSLTPGAYASSNMCPVAITDGAVEAVLGAAGGNQIVPTLAQIIAMKLFADTPIEEAVRRPRITTGAVRNIVADLDLEPAIVDALAKLAPVSRMQTMVYPRPFAAPAAIARENGLLVGAPDTTYPAADAAVSHWR